MSADVCLCDSNSVPDNIIKLADVLMQLSCAAYVEHLQYADTLGYYWFL